MASAGNDIPWPCNAEGYELEKEIGQGAFATVWKAYCKKKLVHVAIKIMDLENVTHAFEDIRQEVNAMRLCDHPNVVRCYSSFVHGNELWLVMKFMDKGSCFHVMDSAKRFGKQGGMQEDWIAYILRETLCGLQYFHQNGQIHRDIKAGNILLSSNGTVQLADFGVAGWLIGYGNRISSVKSFVGTPCWMAPEVMEQVDGYDQKADIWSVGITALELAKGYAPYAKHEPMKVLLMTIEQDPPGLKSYKDDKQPNGESFSRSFKEFVRLCLQKDPKKRPTCTTLLNSSFLKKKDIGPRALISEFLNVIDCVGESEMVGRTKRLRGTKPASFYKNEPYSEVGNSPKKGHLGSILESNIAIPEAKVVMLPPRSHPAGTTWVFEDGSQVVVRPDDNRDEQKHQKEEVQDFFNEFEAQGFTDDGMKP